MFIINNFIDALDQHDEKHFLIFKVAKVVLLDPLVSDFKPVAKILPKLFLVEFHFLVNVEMRLHRMNPTLSCMVILYRISE